MSHSHRWISALCVNFLFAFSNPYSDGRASAQAGGWESLGGQVLEEPACVSWGANRIDCFARGTDNALWHIFWIGGAWTAWEWLLGTILEQPSCVSWGVNRIDCFARGTDRAMWHRWWDGTDWRGWVSRGGATGTPVGGLLNPPSCISRAADRIDCFGRGADSAMWHTRWNGSDWSSWSSLLGTILEAPSCVSRSPNRIDCFARGTDRAMWHRWWDGTDWRGWVSRGGATGTPVGGLQNQPSCVSRNADHIDCFARGADGAMWHTWWSGGDWSDWASHLGVIREQPSCISWDANRIDCFARGTDNAIWHRYWNGSVWRGWVSLGGVIKEQPSCVSWGANRIDCFARATSSPTDNPVWHRFWPQQLQISRYTTATLSNANADAILTAASTLLQTGDGTDDVACPASFTRDGPVTVFTTGDGSVDSQAEFNAVNGLPGHVKVVNALNFPSPSMIGYTSGNSFVVERFTPSQEGSQWAHEFGHTKGLGHRADPNAVMNSTIGANSLRVDWRECNAYLLTQAPPMGVAAAAQAEPSANGGLSRIEDFVRQTYVHGVPEEEAGKYGSAVVPSLLTMLSDRAEERYWVNIVVVLGLIGDERAVDPLVAFIAAGQTDTLTRDHYKAKTAALISMGYLINKTGSRKALDYLTASVSPEIWATRGVVGRAPFQGGMPERNHDFSKKAVLGLALSGRPEAAQILRSLQQPAATESQRSFQTRMSALVAEAIEQHQQISSQGLINHLRTIRLQHFGRRLSGR